MGIIILGLLIVFFVGFAISYLLFKKVASSKPPFSNVWYWLSAPIFSFVLLVGSIYSYLYLSSRYEEKEFDKVVWMKDYFHRYEYVDDLIESQHLIGMDSMEVIQYIGVPSYLDNTTFEYNIGYDPKQYFNMDPDWLFVEFGEGKVVETYIVK